MSFGRQGGGFTIVRSGTYDRRSKTGADYSSWQDATNRATITAHEHTSEAQSGVKIYFGLGQIDRPTVNDLRADSADIVVARSTDSHALSLSCGDFSVQIRVLRVVCYFFCLSHTRFSLDYGSLTSNAIASFTNARKCTYAPSSLTIAADSQLSSRLVCFTGTARVRCLGREAENERRVCVW